MSHMRNQKLESTLRAASLLLPAQLLQIGMVRNCISYLYEFNGSWIYFFYTENMVKINFNSNHRVSRRHVPLPDVMIRNWMMRQVSAMLSQTVVWESGIFCANRAVVILPYKFRERKKVRLICVLVKGEARYKTTLWLISERRNVIII